MHLISYWDDYALTRTSRVGDPMPKHKFLNDSTFVAD